MANNEFGDFQTNSQLSGKVVGLLAELTGAPATIIEPTCGKGNLVKATFDAFPASTIHGLEISQSHVGTLEKRFQFEPKFILHHADYFQFDWLDLIPRMAKPIWVIGNPPWVTNSQLMRLESRNLPKKSPQANLRGFDAQTGKSNFDISESMIRDWFAWCASCNGSLAVICKTSVARKLLQWWWKSGKDAPLAKMFLIDAKAEFDVTVSACVLVCSFSDIVTQQVCEVHEHIDAKICASRFGMIDGILVSDADAFMGARDILGQAHPRWRSGLKHDASAVLELEHVDGELRNKAGERVNIEPDFIFPLMKGSDLGGKKPGTKLRSVLVPQRTIGGDTRAIQHLAPMTWRYLQEHRAVFAARKSSIYNKGRDFAIFGIGEYSFKPWKIAIGALYKNLKFSLIGPVDGRPVMFDDTVYFVGFDTYQEAARHFVKLQSEPVQSLLKSMIFWDDMRPVKSEILNRINLSNTLFNVAA